MFDCLTLYVNFYHFYKKQLDIEIIPFSKQEELILKLMSFKKTIVKSAFIATSILSVTASANATWKYNVSLGYGVGLFKFNEDRDDTTFKGDVGFTTNNPLTGNSQVIIQANNASTSLTNQQIATGLGLSTPALRTSYKYIENLPQSVFNIDVGAQKSFNDITLLNRNFFAGVVAGFGYGQVKESKGITNPNARYLSTGNNAYFWTANAKFGLENKSSKVYGLVGMTYAKIDLPYDILPLGPNTTLGDLNTQVVMQNGSLLLASVGGASLQAEGSPALVPITAIQSINQQAAGRIKVKDASADVWLINIGAGLEVNMTESLVLFAEFTQLLQLNKSKTYSIDYTLDDKKGTFKGVIKSSSSQYIKAGVRYYFG